MATTAQILGGHRNGKVSPRWSRQYEWLCSERDRLVARDCTAVETSRTKVDDLTEAASDEAQANLSLVAASATQDAIFEVVAAIRRIESGTYGICELTGRPIEAERLKALPWARYSLEGQTQLERAGEIRRPGLPKLESLSEAASQAEADEAEQQAE